MNGLQPRERLCFPSLQLCRCSHLDNCPLHGSARHGCLHTQARALSCEGPLVIITASSLICLKGSFCGFSLLHVGRLNRFKKAPSRKVQTPARRCGAALPPDLRGMGARGRRRTATVPRLPTLMLNADAAVVAGGCGAAPCGPTQAAARQDSDRQRRAATGGDGRRRRRRRRRMRRRRMHQWKRRRWRRQKRPQ